MSSARSPDRCRAVHRRRSRTARRRRRPIRGCGPWSVRRNTFSLAAAHPLQRSPAPVRRLRAMGCSPARDPSPTRGPVRRILGLGLRCSCPGTGGRARLPLELSPHVFEEREHRAGRRRDASSVSRGQGSERRTRRDASSARSDGSRRVRAGGCCGRGAWIRSGTQCVEAAAGIQRARVAPDRPALQDAPPAAAA